VRISMPKVERIICFKPLDDGSYMVKCENCPIPKEASYQMPYVSLEKLSLRYIISVGDLVQN
jgi:hypothetical protein